MAAIVLMPFVLPFLARFVFKAKSAFPYKLARIGRLVAGVWLVSQMAIQVQFLQYLEWDAMSASSQQDWINRFVYNFVLAAICLVPWRFDRPVIEVIANS